MLSLRLFGRWLILNKAAGGVRCFPGPKIGILRQAQDRLWGAQLFSRGFCGRLAKEEETPAPDGAALGTGEIGLGRNTAEEDEEIPELLQEALWEV
jgi:hypothetical protein